MYVPSVLCIAAVLSGVMDRSRLASFCQVLGVSLGSSNLNSSCISSSTSCIVTCCCFHCCNCRSATYFAVVPAPTCGMYFWAAMPMYVVVDLWTAAFISRSSICSLVGFRVRTISLPTPLTIKLLPPKAQFCLFCRQLCSSWIAMNPTFFVVAALRACLHLFGLCV